MTEEVMAVMRGVKFGLRDVGEPVLSFSTYVSESSAALQVIGEWEEIRKVFIDANATEIASLEGKPCWVRRDRNYILFDRVWKP